MLKIQHYTCYKLTTYTITSYKIIVKGRLTIKHVYTDREHWLEKLYEQSV